MSDKVIVTAAITGNIHTPTMSPYLPITPQQIADEAVRSYEEGAAIAHIHVRTPENGKPVADLDLLRQVLTEVKRRCDMIVCVTTGGLDAQVSKRIAPVREFGLELASFNFGSMNFALHHLLPRYERFDYQWERDYLGMTEDLIFPNTFRTLREFCQFFDEADTKPELEIYDLGMVNNAAFMLQQGFLKRPPHVQFVLGILGGAPASLDNLLFFHRAATSAWGEFTWSVCAAGRHQFPMCTASLIMGGNVRVGMEDNLHISKGVLAKSNGELVAKIVRIGRELGREPASPAEARQILGLKGLEGVRY